MQIQISKWSSQEDNIPRSYEGFPPVEERICHIFWVLLILLGVLLTPQMHNLHKLYFIVKVTYQAFQQSKIQAVDFTKGEN